MQKLLNISHSFAENSIIECFGLSHCAVVRIFAQFIQDASTLIRNTMILDYP